MNYFEHHIGDYDTETSHLSWLEDMAYTRLIRLYYRKECPIPADLKIACRKIRATSKQERQAVETVLSEFFTLQEDGWHQKTCDENIAAFLAGEPEREAKKANEETRLKRHREERATLFQSLTAAGQHAAWNIGIKELRELVKALPATAPATPATATQTPDTTTQTPVLNSVPNGTGGEPPGGQSEKPTEHMTKDELWAAGKSLLQQSGMPEKQCGAFIGKLVKDYGSEIVIEAVQSAVVERPADPTSFLKAACMARKNEGGKTLIPWHATDAGVIAKGKGMDPPMDPHRGETMLQFKARLLAAIENDGKPPDPKPKPALVIAQKEVKSYKPEGIAPLKSLLRTRDPA